MRTTITRGWLMLVMAFMSLLTGCGGGSSSSGGTDIGAISYTAYVGPYDTQISLDNSAAGFNLYRSRTLDCDVGEYASCDYGQVDEVFAGIPITDTALTLSQSLASYTLEAPTLSALSTLTVFPYNKLIEPLDGYQVAEFNGDLYLVGGIEYGSPTEPPVWRYSDYTQAWELHQFFPDAASASDTVFNRTTHAVIAFKNKLWMMGGYHTGSLLNDIWSSEDGKTWTLESAAAEQTSGGPAWSPRSITHLVEYHDELWLIGGVGLGATDYYTDIWSSTDGVHWDLVTDTPRLANNDEVLPNGVWGGDIFVKDDKIWMIGGKDKNGNTINALYTSSDGITWEQLDSPIKADTTTAEIPLFGVRAAVLGDYIYLSGGENVRGDVVSRIWRSEDGVVWEDIGQNPNEGYAQATNFLVHDQHLILDYIVSTTKHKETWTSTDGITWKKMEKDILAKEEQRYFNVGGQLLQLGGYNCLAQGDQSSPEIYVSDDGINWTVGADSAKKPDDSFAFGTLLTDPQIAELNGNIYLIGGYDEGTLNPVGVWKSTDGFIWEELTDTPEMAGGAPAFPDGIYAPVIAFNNKLWVVGGKTFTGGEWVYTNSVWSSDDGIVWELVTDDPRQTGGDPAFSPRGDTSLLIINDKMCLLGGYYQDAASSLAGEAYTESWCSDDGVTWDLASNSTPVITRPDRLAWYQGRIYAAGNYGLFVSSDDGVNWTQIDVGDYADMSEVRYFVSYNGRLFAYGNPGVGVKARTWVSDDGVSFRRVVTGEFFIPN